MINVHLKISCGGDVSFSKAWHLGLGATPPRAARAAVVLPRASSSRSGQQRRLSVSSEAGISRYTMVGGGVLFALSWGITPGTQVPSSNI